MANEEHLFILSGNGDVIEPDDDMAAIGSGGPVCPGGSPGAACAMAKLPLRQIVEESMKIASEICIYTNNEITVDEL